MEYESLKCYAPNTYEINEFDHNVIIYIYCDKTEVFYNLNSYFKFYRGTSNEYDFTFGYYILNKNNYSNNFMLEKIEYFIEYVKRMGLKKSKFNHNITNGKSGILF